MSNTYSLLLSSSNKLDKFISFTIAFQIIFLGCKNVLVQGIPLLYSINDELNVVILGLSLLLYVIAFLLSASRAIGGGYCFFAIFIAISFIVTYVFFPQNIEYLNKNILRTLICCIFTGLLISKLWCIEFLYNYMLKGSYIITFCAILFVIEVRLNGHSTTSDFTSYSMSMSNVVMLAVMFQLHAFFKSNNNCALLCLIIGTIVIFLYGSRNPLLAIFTYVAIQLFDLQKMKGKAGKQLLFFVFCIGGCIFFSIRKQLLIVIASILESFNISSRTLYYLINEDAGDFSTGRVEIHNHIWNVIFDNPIFGTGIAGDEAHIGEMAHSLYLSIFCTYGLFIGSLFVFYIIIKCYYAHKISIGLSHQLLVLFICMVFPRGFTGGDIWQSDVFWWMMGFVFFILTNRNQKEYN